MEKLISLDTLEGLYHDAEEKLEFLADIVQEEIKGIDTARIQDALNAYHDSTELMCAEADALRAKIHAHLSETSDEDSDDNTEELEICMAELEDLSHYSAEVNDDLELRLSLVLGAVKCEYDGNITELFDELPEIPKEP